MRQILENSKSFSIDVKRFYLPFNVDIECPHCGGVNKDDYDDQYMSYPCVNEVEERFMWCDHCDREYSYEVKLRLQLEVL